MSDNKLYWVGFNLVKGIGPARLRALLDFFGDPAIAWQAPADALEAAGLPQNVLDTMLKVRSEVSLEVVWERVEKLGIQVITWEDEAYPRLLKETNSPPPVLYVLGDILPEDEWAVSVVGTRRMTSYGRQVAEEVASALARHGITVVSGMARGIDGAAHKAALQAGGRTFAVLGSGVDRIYPPEHRRLAEQITQNGAVMSDYPPGTPPEASNFPPRNRVVAGLSRAVVVVEAGRTSGALITASFAADQGRDVYATPGGIYAPQSKGTNRLIYDGARPLLDIQDLLDDLDVTHIQEQRSVRAVLPANAVEAQLYEILGREPLHVDEIRARCALPIEEVSAALAMMELKGLVRQVGGMQYIALREESAEYEAGETGESA